jgi:hypothetical protein
MTHASAHPNKSFKSLPDFRYAPKSQEGLGAPRSEGRILIGWKQVDSVIRLEWTEQGGPVVSPPKAHGS